MEEIRATLARSIAQSRKRKGLSQQALAEQLGQQIGRPFDPSQISDWETGKNLPRVDMLIALADALGMSLDRVVKGEQPFIDQVADEAAAILEARHPEVYGKERPPGARKR